MRSAVWDQFLKVDPVTGFAMCQDCNIYVFANGEGMPKCNCTPGKNYNELVAHLTVLKQASIDEEDAAIQEKKDAESAAAVRFPHLEKKDLTKNNIAPAVYNSYKDHVVPAYENDPDGWDESILGATYLQSMQSFTTVYNKIGSQAEKGTFLDTHIRIRIDQVLATLEKCFKDNGI